MKKKMTIFVVAVALALGSFAFARYRYVENNSLKAGDFRVSFVERNLFGDWVKDEIVFAIVIPLLFVGAGAVIAFRK